MVTKSGSRQGFEIVSAKFSTLDATNVEPNVPVSAISYCPTKLISSSLKNVISLFAESSVMTELGRGGLTVKVSVTSQFGGSVSKEKEAYKLLT